MPKHGSFCHWSPTEHLVSFFFLKHPLKHCWDEQQRDTAQKTKCLQQPLSLSLLKHWRKKWKSNVCIPHTKCLVWHISFCFLVTKGWNGPHKHRCTNIQMSEVHQGQLCLCVCVCELQWLFMCVCFLIYAFVVSVSSRGYTGLVNTITLYPQILVTMETTTLLCAYVCNCKWSEHCCCVCTCVKVIVPLVCVCQSALLAKKNQHVDIHYCPIRGRAGKGGMFSEQKHLLPRETLNLLLTFILNLS